MIVRDEANKQQDGCFDEMRNLPSERVFVVTRV